MVSRDLSVTQTLRSGYAQLAVNIIRLLDEQPVSISSAGPKGLPIFGSLFDVMRNAGKAGDEMYHHQLMLKYGPIVKVTILGKTACYVASVDSTNIALPLLGLGVFKKAEWGRGGGGGGGYKNMATYVKSWLC